jgi:hypothetical protein
MSGYAGAGQAKLLSLSAQGFCFAAETVAVGELSLAFELQRPTSTYYPWGFAVEIQCSASPGTFEIDVMGAETDASANFVKLGSITAVNSTFVGRFDTVAFFPRYVALYVATWPNTGVAISGKITR